MSEIDYNAVAMALIESYLGRPLSLERRTERYPASYRVALRAWPVQAVKTVSRVGRWPAADVGTVLTDEDYTLDEARGIMGFPSLAPALMRAEASEWRPRGASEVDGPELIITYDAGYEELPGPIQAAAALIAAALKTADENGGQQITYQALDGYQVTYSSRYMDGNDLTMLSPAAVTLLAPYRA